MISTHTVQHNTTMASSTPPLSKLPSKIQSLTSNHPLITPINCAFAPIFHTFGSRIQSGNGVKTCVTFSSKYPLERTSRNGGSFICRAAEYKFPDPIPEFADAETEKFKAHLLKKLSKKEMFEDSVDEVVGICTEIFTTFLHTEYGGPGTLLVEPFIDMADALNERGFSGPQAARAAVKWAQDHVDKDWKEWTGTG